MRISSYIPLSLLDYPKELTQVIGTQGCNLNCSYCHNKHLIPDIFPLYEDDYLKGKISASPIKCLTITGGEPTLQRDTLASCKFFSKKGYKIKIDTNGTNYNALKELLPFITYVAIDIKTDDYSKLHTDDTPYHSLILLQESNINFEVRTTLSKDYLTPESLFYIKKKVRCSKWYLQYCRGHESFTPKEIKELKLDKYVRK